MKKFLVVLCFILGLFGCAHTVIRSAYTFTAYEQVFEAARQAALENRFGITSADMSSGLINGRQGVLFGRGHDVFLNIKVSKGNPNSVEVVVTPPHGTSGNTDAIVRNILKSIKTRVPDLTTPD